LQVFPVGESHSEITFKSFLFCGVFFSMKVRNRRNFEIRPQPFLSQARNIWDLYFFLLSQDAINKGEPFIPPPSESISLSGCQEQGEPFNPSPERPFHSQEARNMWNL
jgi:hypothetical protein